MTSVPKEKRRKRKTRSLDLPSSNEVLLWESPSKVDPRTPMACTIPSGSHVHNPKAMDSYMHICNLKVQGKVTPSHVPPSSIKTRNREMRR